jgi:RNA polymerase sigma-70 factor (ECF subfamily)
VYVELFSFDEEYLGRLRRGDPPTEQHFVAYFGELLLIKLRARRLPAEVAEDIRQETFARVFFAVRSEAGIRQPDRLGAFVNSVCNNVLQEHWRSSSRLRTVGDDMPDFIDKRIDLEGALVTKQICQVVQKVLLSLPEKDGRLLRAVFLEEKGREEMCQEFQVDREYLRVLLHRARDRFKAGYLKQ